MDSSTSSISFTYRPPKPPSPFDLPPFVVHSIDFLRHFVLSFLLPIFFVIFCGYVAAVIVLQIRRAFTPYATPNELLENATNQLERSKHSRRTSSRYRQRALDTLRLVIQLRPDMIKPYTVLATELFYSEIADGSGEESEHQLQAVNSYNNTTRARRQVQSAESKKVSNNLSPTLVECQDIIQQGLDKDPKNVSLIKLQNELKLVKQYGRDGPHTKMMNIGSFGWMSG